MPSILRSLSFFLAFTLLLTVPGHAAPLVSSELNTGWQFRQRVAVPAAAQTAPSAVAPQWRTATVPGDVHLDLLANHLIPDPFVGDNEARLQWIENADWEYRTTLDATPALLHRDHQELLFDGLDAYAEVYLNGHLLLTADNMFRAWRVDIKPFLKPGANELLVVFPSPIQVAARIAATDKYHGQTPAPDKSYLRKAAYEYGWDWGPTFVTSGIWRPVHLQSWDQARIEDLYIRQRDITPSLARVEAQLTVQSAVATHATVQLDYALSGQPHQLQQAVDLVPGENHLTLPVEIANPALWYPNGYGDQALYTFNASILTQGREQDHTTTRTGLRSVVLRRDRDQYGRSFEFVVNGIPIFAKGADVIPFDSFPSRVTTEQYRRILQSAHDANMNMVRNWGGGYYESAEFFQLCDELGIMVWQDFMFGNDWQPGTHDFRQQVAQEAAYQVTRLRNHPSIVLWCGNNETEESLGWAKNAIASRLDTNGHVRIWQDYLLLFNDTLPRVVARLNPETPYWPSSPSGEYEDDLPAHAANSQPQATGDAHDWSVWHGRVPFTDYEQHFFRFVSEYGFQSFPEMKTVEAFTTPADRASIFTPVMLSHQKNNEGNSIIHDYLLRDYAEPRDFPSFLYVSQVLQAEGIKIGAESLRRNRPRAMGSLFWQLNDCWPVASWSSIDYYGRWKALQYYARRFYSPLLVSPHVENGTLAVYVVSDKTQPVAAKLHLRILTFDGTVVLEQTTPVQLPPLSSATYINLPLTEISARAPIALNTVVATADLLVDGHSVSSNLIYLAPTKQIQLPAASIRSQLTPAPGGFDLTLSAPVLARDVYLTLDDSSSGFSDNYLDLLPNQPVTVHIATSLTETALRTSLKITSLVDAFPAAAANAPPPKLN